LNIRKRKKKKEPSKNFEKTLADARGQKRGGHGWADKEGTGGKKVENPTGLFRERGVVSFWKTY